MQVLNHSRLSTHTGDARWSVPRAVPLAALLAVVVAGCANPKPAPIEYRRVVNEGTMILEGPPPPPLAIAPQAPEPVPEGFYRVKPGDTIIAISLEHGVSWRDVVTWNQLPNPNLIEVGQLLRVRPTRTASTSTATAPAAGPTEVRPIAPRTSAVPQTAEAANGKTTQTPSASAAPAASETQATTAAAPGTSAASAPPTKQVAKAAAPASPAPEAASGSSGGSSVAGAAGRWGWPGNGNVIGQFSDSGSKGISIAGNEGDPVVAASDGRVVYSGSGLRGYGNLVIVKHEDDFLTAYAHNKAIMVSEGQTVKRGQKIAELGKTDSDVPKLHFEVRKAGKPVDPLTYLPPR